MNVKGINGMVTINRLKAIKKATPDSKYRYKGEEYTIIGFSGKSGVMYDTFKAAKAKNKDGFIMVCNDSFGFHELEDIVFF